jgi:hypothetical protein
VPLFTTSSAVFPEVSLGLLVGYTPGASVVDLDVRKTHEFWLTKAGFQPHELVVKGRHFEEGPGGALIYAENVELAPAAAPGPEQAGEDDVELAQARVEKPSKKKGKKKKKRKQRR